MSVLLIQGDARSIPLADRSVHCCVCSPPYWGLRDYGVEGQLGLEKTPDEYIRSMVEVFREVKRVLRDDGTLWLNMGDSYAGSWGNYGGKNRGSGIQRDILRGSQVENSAYDELTEWRPPASWTKDTGLKPKDLVGVPWALATALRAPYYTGRIKNERDRIWLAAILDGEGSISGFRHDRKDDGRTRTGVNICITNSCTLMLDEAQRIWPGSRHVHMRNARLGKREIFRWVPFKCDENSELLREMYPYLLTKKRQALVAWNLLEFVKDGRKLGKSSQATEVREKRNHLTQVLSLLNKGQAVDIPSWLKEPPSCLEPGWYLRSDIIWAKPNPMPESVTDRPTKAHEYIFLLSKSERYYYDADAILEPVSENTHLRISQNLAAQIGSERANGGSRPERPMKAVARSRKSWNGAKFDDPRDLEIRPTTGRNRKQDQVGKRTYTGFNERWRNRCPKDEARDEQDLRPSDRFGRGPGWRKRAEAGQGIKYNDSFDESVVLPVEARNKRSVWTVNVQGFAEAHFATFPKELIKPCILAGCPAGGTVLDPFVGSGTTALVAQNLQCHAVGIELNPAYLEIAKRRLVQSVLSFTT